MKWNLLQSPKIYWDSLLQFRLGIWHRNKYWQQKRFSGNVRQKNILLLLPLKVDLCIWISVVFSSIILNQYMSSVQQQMQVFQFSHHQTWCEIIFVLSNVTSFTLNLTYARPVTHTLIGSIKEFFALKVKVKVANLQLLLEAVKRYVLERPIPVVIVVLI